VLVATMGDKDIERSSGLSALARLRRRDREREALTAAARRALAKGVSREALARVPARRPGHRARSPEEIAVSIRRRSSSIARGASSAPAKEPQRGGAGPGCGIDVAVTGALHKQQVLGATVTTNLLRGLLGTFLADPKRYLPKASYRERSDPLDSGGRWSVGHIAEPESPPRLYSRAR